MTSSHLKNQIKAIGPKIVNALLEDEEALRGAIEAKLIEEDAQESEAKPIFKIGCAITLDLSSVGDVTAKLSWSVRHTLTVEANANDDIPGQQKLEFAEDGSTL